MNLIRATFMNGKSEYIVQDARKGQKREVLKNGM